MEDLFISADKEIILTRIHQLNPAQKPLWGKMNVVQMMEHCCVGFDIALEKKILKRSFIGLLFGKIAKQQMLKSQKPFKKNLPTAPEFLEFEHTNFKPAQQQLIQCIEDFYYAGEQGITKKAHPFFGYLTAQEWSTLLYKHVHHHLTQFAV